MATTTERVEGRPARGCPSAADELASFRADLYRFAYHLTRDRAAADTLYRNSLLKAFDGCQELEEAASPRARLFGIATTIYLADRRRGAPGEEPTGRGRPATVCGDRLDGEALRREVEAGAAALPRRQWVALVQRWYFNLGYKEIAASLCSSEAAARTSVYEALRAMRAHLERRV